MQSVRVLIAEDDSRFRETLVLEFRDLGVETLWVSSVEDFVSVEEVEFTHGVVDLRLGTSSGLQLIEKILAVSPDCRIVMLTGYGSIATAVKAVKLGAVDYLTKPVRFSDLHHALFGDTPIEPTKDAPDNAELSLARVEREYIESVLARCEGNVSKAARILGLHRQSLQRKLRKFTPQ